MDAKSLTAGIVTGAVGIWLMVLFFQTEHTDYQVQEASQLCEKARFNLQFARTSGDVPEQIAAYRQEIQKFCANRDALMQQRDDEVKENNEKLNALNKEIEKSLGSGNGDASPKNP
jgi:hypothetical protein